MSKLLSNTFDAVGRTLRVPAAILTLPTLPHETQSTPPTNLIPSPDGPQRHSVFPPSRFGACACASHEHVAPCRLLVPDLAADNRCN